MTDDTPRSTIDGVIVRSLRVISDARGAVLHMLRSDAPGFAGFGEAYFSEILPGVTKAWKRHRRTTQQLAVPAGRVRFMLMDGREDSPTHGARMDVELGRPDAYRLLVIPPMVWYGWTCLGETPALVANCISEPFDAGESEQTDALPILK